MTQDNEWVRIERSFDAPIDRVWKMWTDANMFKAWYGPNGASVPVADMDLVVGGRRKICMEMKRPDGVMSMWFTGAYTDIDPPRRLAYTESMCDADGNILSPQSMGMPEGSPETTEIIIELSETGGKTHMVLTHVGVPAGSRGAGGWGQALDKMGAMLTT